MMKTEIIIIKKTIRTIILSGLLLTASCDRFLDELPDKRTEVDEDGKVSKILVSAYSVSTPTTMHELMSDNVADSGSGVGEGVDLFAESYQFRDITSEDADSPFAVWQNNYKAVAAANKALEAIRTLEKNGAALSANKGEALLCRAFAHFTLVNTFCQAYNSQTSTTDLGIPYVEDVETSAVNTYGRGTVSEVYEKINADIEAGLSLIDDNAYTKPKFHFNKRAAYAFAAQFNLYYGEYQKSVDYATVAIGEDPTPLFRDYSLWKSYTNTAEWTAAWVRSDEKANFLILPQYSYAGYYYYFRFVITYSLLDETINIAGPWSGELVFSDFLLSSASRSYIFPKQNYYFEYTDQVAGIGYFHVVTVPFTVEKTLIDRAEANVMLGNYANASRDLSYFYTGSGASAGAAYRAISSFYATYEYNKKINPRFSIADGTQTNLIHACLSARRVMTVHDGTRLLDIKRYGIAFEHKVQNGVDVQVEAFDKRLAIQLPETVIASGMEQNPR